MVEHVEPDGRGKTSLSPPGKINLGRQFVERLALGRGKLAKGLPEGGL